MIQGIEWLGQNPLILGISTLFGLLSGLEFLIRYLFRTAAFTKWVGALGAVKLISSSKRAFREDLAFVRRLRSIELQEIVLKNIRTRILQNLFFAVLMVMIFFGVKSITDNAQNLTAWQGTALGFLFRQITEIFFAFYARSRIRKIVANPSEHRRKVLRHLKRLKS